MLDVFFESGVDPYSGIQQLMVDDGTLTAESGNRFTFKDADGKPEVIRGFKFKEWIQEHQDLLI